MHVAYENLCMQVAYTDRGDMIFRILGKKIYCDVAEVSFVYGDNVIAKEYIRNVISALKRWWANPIFEREYRKKALEGKINPKKTWEKIKKEFKLMSDFDIKKVEYR